jgi:nicotinamide riboside kinase
MITLSITGPESSGKTTLANDLAQALEGAVVVPEFARFYLGAQGSEYGYTDFLAMLSGQRAWEEWYAAKCPDYLICDTDPLVFEVWAQERFGSIPTDLTDWNKKRKADLHLLCVPDMIWEPDPLREHPCERERLFEVYQALLGSKHKSVIELRGDRLARVQKVLAILAVPLEV